ncbi:DUF6803 family protein [Bacillus smithii]|uniref:DUF6803 family protein n=1 Tax=Bacillus smithii TaxID=1479 RepID=UPI003D212329
MQMTHYMSLLMENQPWNLIIFMAIPIIMVEAITIMEFFIIFNRQTSGTLRLVNKIASIFIGFYFTGISIYLFKNLVIPLTQTGGWLTWVDVVALGFYLSTPFFLLPLALMELGLIFKKKTEEKKIKIRYGLISAAIVVFCLIGMIFGMVRISQTPGNDKMDMQMNMQMK